MAESNRPIIRACDLVYRAEETAMADGREFQVILDGMSFEVHRGEVFGIMGMSGAGKTSVLRLLMGLVQPTSGDIEVLGRSIIGLPEYELNRIREQMGMCFQYAALLDSMTVADNVAFALRRRSHLSRQEIERKVEEHLERVGMSGTGNQMPAELSGGMKKRVGIARALITEPQVILYDEPSAGLDPIMASVIDNLIVGLRDEFGMTSVVVTHEVEELFGISDRVMMIYQGKVVACDTPEALRGTDNPYVQQFVRGQAHGPIAV